MEKDIQNLLKLQGVILYKVEFKENEIFVRIGRPKKEAICPVCGKITRSCHQRPKKERKVFHHKIMGKDLYLILKRRRFRCKGCKKVFSECFPQIKNWERITSEGKKMILSGLKDLSFRRISQIYRKSYSSLRKILLEGVPLEISWERLIQGSEDGFLYLGVDEHSFRGQNLVISVAEVKQRKLLSILPDSKKESLVRFFQSIPENVKRKIKEVCIDMRFQLKEAIKSTLGDERIVLDKFHLISDAGRRLDEARKIEQEIKRKRIRRKIFLKAKERLTPAEEEKLHELLILYPYLKEYYFIKEALRSLYEEKRKDLAERKFSLILSVMEESPDPEIRRWRRTLRDWRKYILNYFNSKTTNAYIEGAHTKIKMIKRISYGFRNIEVYVKKVFLSFLPISAIYFYHTF